MELLPLVGVAEHGAIEERGYSQICRSAFMQGVRGVKSDFAGEKRFGQLRRQLEEVRFVLGQILPEAVEKFVDLGKALSRRGRIRQK